MSKSNRTPKNVTTKTTAIEILPPQEFSSLESQYRLVKYVLPRILVFDKDADKYAKMHHEIKEHLNVPYRVFTHDQVNGKKRWSLFALFPTKEGEQDAPPVLNFAGEPLTAKEISFSEPPLHILVKLLQVAYTRKNEHEERKSRFVGQDKCYIYAMRSDELGHYHICLEMEIRGDIQHENIFYIDGHARTFALDSTLNPDYIHRNTYFTTIPIKDDMIIFNQVKRTAVQQYVKSPSSAPALYSQRTFSGRRTTLDFHSVESLEDTEQTRGYLTDTFIRGFSKYLQNFDFQVEHISRNFEEFVTDEIAEFTFDIANLNEIYLYDARLNQKTSLNSIMKPLFDKLPAIEFEITKSLDEIGTSPLIVIEDCEARAFKEGMPLHGESDPHEEIYRQYPQIPKQFINVNTNSLSLTQSKKTKEDGEATLSTDDYLLYEPLEMSETQITMLMNQLYLKDLILNQHNVLSRLPILSDFMFVHREHQVVGGAKRRFEVALRFVDNKIKFYDLINDDEDRTAFNEVLNLWQVDWDDNYSKMIEHQRGNEYGKDLPDFDVIIGSELFVEITGASEAILYDYEEIIRRHEEFIQPFELEDLKLAHKYDEIVDDPNLTEEILEMWGYLPHQQIRGKRLRKPKNQSHRDAIRLYENLHKYDELLDELKDRYPTISFHELTRDENIVPDIVRLFGNPLKLQNKYKKVKMFLGLREADVVSVHTGIWHTHDFRYVIGSKTSMNASQARAHRVRQFIVYQGDAIFDIEPMLDAMSVTFVRLNQYTVYPYYFHLIDIYINNVVKYKLTPINFLDIDIDDEID